MGFEPTFYLLQSDAKAKDFTSRNPGRRGREQLLSHPLIDKGIPPRCGCGTATMAIKMEAIREAAQRVAASHGLDVVDLEFAGPAKERALRVSLEKNAEGRAQLKAAIEAGGEDLPERLTAGTLNIEQLSGITHEDCSAFSRDFGVLLDVEELTERADNAIKFLSDMFSARLYRLASTRIGVPDYKNLVAQKLKTAEDLYQYMVEQFNQSRAFLLEVTVVLILLIELYYAFRGHPV